MFVKVIKLKSIIAVLVLFVITLTVSVTLRSISTTASTIERKLPIYSVQTKEKKIAITFDAAWSAEDTKELIEILKKHGVKITVFAVGEWVTRNPEAVKSFYENGHEIGNHSATHPAFSKLSREEIRQEIVDCNKEIEKITGAKPRILRAPSGDYDNKSVEVTESLGMKIIQWDVDSLDYKGLSVDEIYSRITDRVQNGSIVLFHNGVENTPEALDKILTKLKNDGYEFVTVSELIYWDNFEIDHAGRQIKVS